MNPIGGLLARRSRYALAGEHKEHDE